MTGFMHGFRATLDVLSCTVSVHVWGVHHARVGVQHKRPNLAPQPCNLPCTPVGATQDNLYRTTKPVMHCVQDGRSIYRNYSMTTVDLPDHRRNHRPRARRGEPAMAKRLNREELLNRLRELHGASGDIEAQHSIADAALLDYIADPEITEAYEAIERWYA